MEKINGYSLDIVKENISKLKEIFPEVFCEDKVDFERLQEVLGEYIEDKEERYRFEWHGKSQAIRMSQTPSRGTLRPCKEESKNWDTTENLYIEGDNLEVLKLLQKSYQNKIKMIYIDPPYNTGNDFVYKDDYKDNLSNYLAITGQIDEEGYRTSTNSDTSGRYHTEWLNMMYPRLRLARNLLTEDGVIFISIGEQEFHNLKKIGDEVFGEDNFIGCAGRISKKANNQGDYWAPNFDYILTYTKNRDFCVPFFGGINYSSYNLIEEEGSRKGEYYQLVRLYMTSLDPMRGCTNQRYFIECPDGSLVIPPGNIYPDEKKDGASVIPQSGKDKVWRWSKKTYEENKDKIVVKKVRSSNLVNENGEETFWNVFTKTYLNDVISKSSATPNNFIEEHINQSASHELNKLGIPFDFAKPSSLIKFLSKTCRVGKEEIVLDFFSGSASSANAVMDLNLEDGGNRKFIMIQLPEVTDISTDAYKDGYNNICEIGKERIRRAGDKIVEENKDKVGIDDLDIGFKVFKLDTSNIKPWNPKYDNVEMSLEDVIDNFLPGRTEEDVVYEIMLKYGIDLTYPIEVREVSGKKVFSIGFGALIICLDDEITLEVVNGIVDLRNELTPETTRVVFKDNGFKTDSVKTNTIEILKRNNITEIMSI
ncbi:site-specific DNA-methyltransferase [Clostridium sp. UBA5988]|uniref:site-specific DNA-methyltransferase n=1 Tax=Clostridium sp. UBA5988 TaxID=1946369 RepID=UPI003216249D